MLIIRDFGHLGMQTVIDGKSKYSCDRLVNFTKEIQTRRRKSSEVLKESNAHSFDYMSKIWHSNYIHEAIAFFKEFKYDIISSKNYFEDFSNNTNEEIGWCYSTMMTSQYYNLTVV